MSDSVDLKQIPSLPLTIHPSSIENEETNRKFVNKYLSTAVHYLSRTKSFHVAPNKTTVDFPSNKLIEFQTNDESPTNLFDLPSTNSQGIVNTLRRSLRKSKERFYNKRSATMKSCHSLHNDERLNVNLDSPKIDFRRDFSTKSCSTTPKILTMRKETRQIIERFVFDNKQSPVVVCCCLKIDFSSF